MDNLVGQSLGPMRIAVAAPDGAIRYVPMKPKGLVTGSRADVDIVLKGEGVSPRHAQFTFDGTDYFVTDLNSAQGTLLDEFKLLPNSPQKWRMDKAVRIGEYHFRLDNDNAGGVPPDIPLVGVVMDEHDFSVVPGNSVTLSLTVINQSQIVDHYLVTVTGIPVEWVGEIPRVQLLPGAHQAVPIRIQVPRVPASHAGVYALTLRAVSDQSPEEFAETDARLTVAFFQQWNSRITPERVYAGAPCEVQVQNLGNEARTVNLSWSEPANAVIFTPAALKTTVEAGADNRVPFTAVPRVRRWLGGEVVYPYSINLTPEGSEPMLRYGQLVAPSLIPMWVLPVALAAVALVCVAIYVVVYILPYTPPVVHARETATAAALQAAAAQTATAKAKQLAAAEQVAAQQTATAAAQQTAQAIANWNGYWERDSDSTGSAWSSVYITLKQDIFTALFSSKCDTPPCDSRTVSGVFDGNPVELSYRVPFSSVTESYTFHLSGNTLRVVEVSDFLASIGQKDYIFVTTFHK